MNHLFSTTKIKNATHVIFDLDGLLIDSETVYRKVISDIARRYGKKYTVDVEAKLVGTPEKESSKIAVKQMKLPISADEFQKEFKRNSYLKLTSVPLLTGAEKVIKHLHSTKIPIAIATSSNNEGFAVKTQNHKHLLSLFSHIVCGESDPEVKLGKPHPDIFLVCASRFRNKPKPENCLVFEDSRNGVLAAIKAKMQCVMVPDKRLSPEFRKEATIVIETLSDFKPELFGLPPYN